MPHEWFVHPTLQPLPPVHDLAKERPSRNMGKTWNARSTACRSMDRISLRLKELPYGTVNLRVVPPSLTSSPAVNKRGDFWLSLTDPPFTELMIVPLTEP